jgi:single-strand DNA-binding protein
MNLNKVFLIGRLTQDPEVRSTPSGQNVASFGLATNRNWTDQSGQKQEQTEFHSLVVWRKLADIAGQYLKKGQLLMVEGRLQTRNWVGQDGVKRYRTEVVVENLQMGPKSQGQGYAGPRPAGSPMSQPQESMGPEIPVIQVEEQISDLPNLSESPDSEVVPF